MDSLTAPCKTLTQRLNSFAIWTLGFLFVIGFSYFQHHPSGDGLLLSFNTGTWIVASVFIGLTLLYVARIQYWVSSRLTRQLLLCLGLILLPGLLPKSGDLLEVGRFYGLLGGALFLVCLTQLRLSESQTRSVIMAILAGVILQAIFGWAQFLELVPEGWFGYGPSTTRPFGIFRQPNVMGSFLATGLVLSAFLIGWQNREESKNCWLQWGCVLLPLLIVPLLVMLNSRAGWLGALVGVAMILPWLYRQVETRKLLIWLIAIFAGVLIGVALLAANDQLATTADRVQIDPVRRAMYPVVIDLFQANIFSGVGLGNFESAFNAFAADQYASGEAVPSGVTNLHHPHNELLFWAVEGGLISLAGLLLAAWFVLLRVIKLGWLKGLAFTGLFFPIVLHTQTEYPFYHSAIHWLLFLFLIYLLDSQSSEMKVNKLRSTLLIGTAGVVIPVCISAFMITTLQAAAILQRFESAPDSPPEMLLDIVNPMVWRDRLLWQVRTNIMYGGIARGDLSGVPPFIELITERIEDKPRWQNYQDLIFAHDFIEQTDQADALYEEAEYRFPTRDFYRLESGTLTLRSYEPEPVEVEIEQP